MSDANKTDAVPTGPTLSLGQNIGGWTIRGPQGNLSPLVDSYPVEQGGRPGTLRVHRLKGTVRDKVTAKLAGLSHPNILPFLGSGNHEGWFWEVWDQAVPGISSRQGLDEAHLMPLVRSLNEALKSAHSAGILHRNLRTSSVVMRGEDLALGEFATLQEAEGDLLKRWNAGYAAPEVYSGVVGPEVDYYSLGILVWEAATGSAAFAGLNPQFIIRDTIGGRAVDDLMDRAETRGLSDRTKTLVQGLLTTRHDKRWGFSQVAEWLSQAPALLTASPSEEATSVTIGPEGWGQAFLDGLGTGSTVHLKPGQYRGAVILRKALHLVSVDPKEPATLVPEDLPSDRKSRAMTIEAGTGSLKDLLFRGENFSNQILLTVSAGTWTLDKVEFRGAYDTALVVGGEGTAPKVRHTKIHGGNTGVLIERQAKGVYDHLEVLDHIKNNIAIQDQGTAPHVKNGRFAESKQCGISVSKGAGGTFEDNDILGNTLANVLVRDHGTDPVFKNNRLHEGKRGGFYLLEGAAGTYEGNDVFANSTANVEVKDPGTEPRFRANKIHDGKQGGLSIYGGAGGIYEGNEVFANTLANVFVFQSGTAPEFRDNRIHDGKHAGFSIYGGASGEYEDNDISGNAQANIIVFQTGTAPVFVGNKVHSGRQGGFFIHGGAGGQYEDNEVFDNALANVEILDQGTNPHFKKNKIHSCLNEGVFIQNGAAGRFEGNEFYGNGFSTKGLKDAGPGYPSIRVKDAGTNPVFVGNRVVGFAGAAFEISKGASGRYEDNIILDFDKDNHFVFEKKWDIKWGTAPKRKNNTEN